MIPITTSNVALCFIFVFVLLLECSTLSNAFTTTTTTKTKTRLYSTAAVDESISVSILKKELLSMIPKRPLGAPATNITTDISVVEDIRRVSSNLEYLTPLPPLVGSTKAVETLDGGWQLVYSDASEIRNIVKLPFGFRLGPVYQPIDIVNSKVENQALIKHKLRLFSGHTRVIANFELAKVGVKNRAGVINKNGERVNVLFNKVIFTLRRFLVLPTFGKIRKTAKPKGAAEKEDGIVPSIDITYLDDTMRISRGGDGSLFILIRPKSNSNIMPMLSKDVVDQIQVKDATPTYDASKDILPGSQ
mmetsp:Transcript_43035/g.48852  ORF Transcript_43035/g.48852 Transcript_43035/m.48852 type:complete len:304 (-) Transcript_43035:16-927(-)